MNSEGIIGIRTRITILLTKSQRAFTALIKLVTVICSDGSIAWHGSPPLPDYYLEADTASHNHKTVSRMDTTSGPFEIAITSRTTFHFDYLVYLFRHSLTRVSVRAKLSSAVLLDQGDTEINTGQGPCITGSQLYTASDSRRTPASCGCPHLVFIS